MKTKIKASELRRGETFTMRNLRFVHHGDLQVEQLTGVDKGLRGFLCQNERVWRHDEAEANSQ